MTSPTARKSHELSHSANHSLSIREATRSWVNVGAKESVRPTHDPSKQGADSSHCRVEAVAEAVVVGVVSDQSVQTTRKCPKKIRVMRTITMN